MRFDPVIVRLGLVCLGGSVPRFGRHQGVGLLLGGVGLWIVGYRGMPELFRPSLMSGFCRWAGWSLGAVGLVWCPGGCVLCLTGSSIY
jgi:hypothetical protein